MFILGNLLEAVAKILYMVFNLYMWVIIIRAVISWVSPDPYNPLIRILYQITEPVLSPIRRLIPLRGMGIDISPIIVIMIIYFLNTFLVQSILDIAVYIKS